jgi:hypothetical protein
MAGRKGHGHLGRHRHDEVGGESPGRRARSPRLLPWLQAAVPERAFPRSRRDSRGALNDATLRSADRAPPTDRGRGDSCGSQ